jgi:hypothetical protein
MSRLWLVKGPHDAPGWDALRDDSKAETVDILHLDPRVWALMRSGEPPSGYEGLRAVDPPDGMYLDPNGSPLYLAGGDIVSGPDEVIEAIGHEAKSLLSTLGDPITVLERLGRTF